MTLADLYSTPRLRNRSYQWLLRSHYPDKDIPLDGNWTAENQQLFDEWTAANKLPRGPWMVGQSLPAGFNWIRLGGQLGIVEKMPDDELHWVRTFGRAVMGMAPLEPLEPPEEASSTPG